jgi:inosine-uridine nucleoside N-ribohydrolase
MKVMPRLLLNSNTKHAPALIPLKRIAFCLVFLLLVASGYGQKQKVWIDADTGNEMDDIYALFYALSDTTIEVVGLSSAHFNNADLVAFSKWNQYETKGINTVQISQALNEELLQVMGKLSIPHPIGADRQMGRAWGGREPRPSEAANEIIAAVKGLGKGEKLHVVTLGALTNIASAIAMDTAIAKRMTCYALGAGYNVGKGYWNKSEFNIRNDLNAFDYLLDNKSLDLVVMPTDVARPYRFERDSLYRVLSDVVPIERMLKQRWEETNPQDKVRILWDLALVEAFLKPVYSVTKPVLTPPENTQRFVRIYTKIDVQKMKVSFNQLLKRADNK